MKELLEKAYELKVKEKELMDAENAIKAKIEELLKSMRKLEYSGKAGIARRVFRERWVVDIKKLEQDIPDWKEQFGRKKVSEYVEIRLREKISPKQIEVPNDIDKAIEMYLENKKALDYIKSQLNSIKEILDDSLEPGQKIEHPKVLVSKKRVERVTVDTRELAVHYPQWRVLWGVKKNISYVEVLSHEAEQRRKEFIKKMKEAS